MFIEGQQVVCINDEFPEWAHRRYDELPQKDTVYTVRAIRPGITDTGKKTPFLAGDKQRGQEDISILVFELVNPEYGPEGRKQEAGFKIDRFVPLEELTEEEILNAGKGVEELALV